VVINCTGQITRPLESCLAVNVRGALHLGEASRAHGTRVVQVSSLAVYGTRETVDESTPMNPETPYGAAKAAAEHILACTVDPSRLVVARLCNLYGEGQRAGVFAYLERSLRSDRALSFDNDGSLLRYYMHAADAAALVGGLAINADAKGIFTVAGAERLTLVELVRTLEQRAGVTFTTAYRDATPPDNIGGVGEARLREHVPHRPEHSVAEYFNEMVSRHTS